MRRLPVAPSLRVEAHLRATEKKRCQAIERNRSSERSSVPSPEVRHLWPCHGPDTVAPRSLWKGAKPCRFADHPTAPVIPVPESVVAIRRNAGRHQLNDWSRSIEIAGRHQPVRAGETLPPLGFASALPLSSHRCSYLTAVLPATENSSAASRREAPACKNSRCHKASPGPRNPGTAVRLSEQHLLVLAKVRRVARKPGRCQFECNHD
jgi:hypothetical protein